MTGVSRMADEILSPEQVAELLGCSPETVREQAAAGDLPGVKFGRDWRFPWAALYETLCKRAVEQAEERKNPPARPLRGARRVPPKLTEPAG